MKILLSPLCAVLLPLCAVLYLFLMFLAYVGSGVVLSKKVVIRSGGVIDRGGRVQINIFRPSKYTFFLSSGTHDRGGGVNGHVWLRRFTPFLSYKCIDNIHYKLAPFLFIFLFRISIFTNS